VTGEEARSISEENIQILGSEQPNLHNDLIENEGQMKLVQMTETNQDTCFKGRTVYKKLRNLYYRSLSNSITDEDITNYNRLFWLKNEPLEALKMWNVGKQIRFTYFGDEESVLNKSEELERRDKKKK